MPDTVFIKNIILKWLFLPVILCAELITVQIESLIIFIPFYDILRFYEDNHEPDNKTNTIVDCKVRMNN